MPGRVTIMTNTFTMGSWDEQLVAGEGSAPRFAHAHTTSVYTGVIEGESACDYLLYYAGEGYDGHGTTSCGMERVEGSVDGRKGSFVIRHDIGFDAERIRGTWTVVEGSGTGELAGLAGRGTMSSPMGGRSVDYTFEYTLP
jgi:hypothetical protein